MAAQPRPEPQPGQEQAAVEEREAPDRADQQAPGRADPQQAAEHAAVVAELEDRWRRALADLDNLRKRYARELDRERAAERARVAAQWLPVVDDLDRALAHADEDPSAVLEGVRAVRDHALAVLARLGYPRYEEVGVPFDPARHEAVQAVPDAEAAPGTVVEVLRPGYGREDHWLRPAAVAVATAQRQ